MKRPYMLWVAYLNDTYQVSLKRSDMYQKECSSEEELAGFVQQIAPDHAKDILAAVREGKDAAFHCPLDLTDEDLVRLFPRTFRH